MKTFKKQFVLIGICAVIGLAVYLNWRISNPKNADEAMDTASRAKEVSAAAESSQNSSEEPSEDERILGEAEFVGSVSEYFDAARLNRQITRNEAINILQELMANENLSEEDRAAAQERLAALSVASDTEGRIENLVLAKGFAECVALIGDSGISIVVQSNGLTETDIVAIKDIAQAETAFAPEDIKIIETR